MSIIVQKFGGSSVADSHHIFNVAKKIIPFYKKGYDVIVVVSAQGDTTDKLVNMAVEINAQASKREMDVLLSAGEQISASLLAMAIQNLGFPAKSLLGWQAGFQTDSVHSNAKIQKIITDRIKSEIKQKNIVIVAGFQGVDSLNDITTLGRGGSDTSAVAIAGEIKADVCKIYTDVDGVYTADPRLVPSARKLDSISYEEMFKLSSLGSQVLKDVSIKTAQKYGVELEVLSSLKNEAKGTIVKANTVKKGNSISGIATEKNLVKVSIVGIEDMFKFKKEIISKLEEKNLIKEPNLKSTSKLNPQSYEFLVEESSLQEVLSFIEKNPLPDKNNFEISYTKDKCKISVVNLEESYNLNIASIIFEALHEINVNIEMTACDNDHVSVVLKSNDLYRAINLIHNKLYEEDYLL